MSVEQQIQPNEVETSCIQTWKNLLQLAKDQHRLRERKIYAFSQLGECLCNFYLINLGSTEEGAISDSISEMEYDGSTYEQFSASWSFFTHKMTNLSPFYISAHQLHILARSNHDEDAVCLNVFAFISVVNRKECVCVCVCV